MPEFWMLMAPGCVGLVLAMPTLWSEPPALGPPEVLAVEGGVIIPGWAGLVAIVPCWLVRAGFWIMIVPGCAGLVLVTPVLWCAVAALAALEADPAEPVPPPLPALRAGNDVHAMNAPISNARFLNEVMFRSLVVEGQSRRRENLSPPRPKTIAFFRKRQTVPVQRGKGGVRPIASRHALQSKPSCARLGSLWMVVPRGCDVMRFFIEVVDQDLRSFAVAGIPRPLSASR
jgi:hypothetical protein